jgi:hypothetical protein
LARLRESSLFFAMKRSFSLIKSDRRSMSKLIDRLPTIVKTLTNLDDHSLCETELEQDSMKCILWNEDHSAPIAIDQNHPLNEFRQSVRNVLHQCLEFAQEMLLVNETDEQIYLIIQKCLEDMRELNVYRKERHEAYIYFSQHPTLEDAMFPLIEIDREQFHRLRLIALHTRQGFLRLVASLTPLPISKTLS